MTGNESAATTETIGNGVPEAAEATTASMFPPGTFDPDPAAAHPARMLAAQAAMELKLFLRHGEQLLIAMVIPIAILITLSSVEMTAIPADPSRVANVIPAVLAVAVMSTAFTGQAIGVGFDRRYGALKRIGATALPRWGIVGGKSLSVLVIVFLQVAVLSGIAVLLGWRFSVAEAAAGIGVAIVGTACFAALGLLLGGTLKAEIVLALANLLWFVFMALAGITIATGSGDGVAQQVARLTPSGALAEGFSIALTGGFPLLALVVCAVWGAVAGWAALRTFRFT